MKTKRKKILWIAVVFIVLFFAASSLLLEVFGKKAVNMMSERLGAYGRTEKISVSVFSGITLENFSLGSGRGKNLFFCKKVSLKPSLLSLFAGRIRVREIILRGANADFEKFGGKWNFETALEKILENSESGIFGDELKIEIVDSSVLVSEGGNRYSFSGINAEVKYSGGKKEKKTELRSSFRPLFMPPGNVKFSSGLAKIRASLLLEAPEGGSGCRRETAVCGIARYAEFGIEMRGVEFPSGGADRIEISAKGANVFSQSFYVTARFSAVGIGMETVDLMDGKLKEGIGKASAVFGRGFDFPGSFSGKVEGEYEQKKDYLGFSLLADLKPMGGEARVSFNFSSGETDIECRFSYSGKERKFRVYGNADYPYTEPALSYAAKSLLSEKLGMVYRKAGAWSGALSGPD